MITKNNNKKLKINNWGIGKAKRYLKEEEAKERFEREILWRNEKMRLKTKFSKSKL
jgi:hypothetical protein